MVVELTDDLQTLYHFAGIFITVLYVAHAVHKLYIFIHVRVTCPLYL
jgi:hypothetical protein